MAAGNDTATAANDREAGDWTVRIVLGLVALTIAAHGIRLLARHTFWYDEAMLLTNIAEADFGALFGPLPFYDQAAPQLYILLLRGLHAIFGVNEIALRLPSWLAGAAAVWIMARAMPGLTALERACAAAVLAGGITFAYLMTEAKQYTFEILGSAALMAMVQRPGTTLRTQLGRLGLLLVAMLSASTFPLAAFAVGAAFLLHGVRRPADAVPTIGAKLRSGGWIFAIAGLIYVLYYAAHIRPAYEALLRNFGYTYQGFGFVRGGSYPFWLAGNLWSTIESHYGILAIIILAAAVVGIWRLRGRGLPYLTQAAALAAAMIALNMAGIYPLLPARFSMFAMPWLALLAGCGIAFGLSRVGDRGMQMIAAAAVTGLVLFPSLVYINAPSEHQARRSIAQLMNARGSPVMVTVSSQPVFDLYLKPHASAAGARRCQAPAIIGYTNRCRALKGDGDGRSVDANTKWYLLNYAAIIGRGVEPVGFPGPDPKAFASAYVDWLVRQVPAGRAVLLFTAPHTPEDTDADPLQARLKAAMTVERLLDERRTPGASRNGLLDRVQR